MIFEPGYSYWVLDEGQYNEMLELLAEFGFEYDLANDFVQASDGNYYAYKDSVNNDECIFLEDYGLLNNFIYAKSVQSTNPV